MSENSYSEADDLLLFYSKWNMKWTIVLTSHYEQTSLFEDGDVNHYDRAHKTHFRF
eukprot:m.171141 g.171141  ORF g.171141 m.171141 type:complete len:56 (-) comp13495_c2_seq2:2477-2644(-)